MGQNASRHTSVYLTDLPLDYYAELLRTSFTVLRSNGKEDEGWQIPAPRNERRGNGNDFDSPWVASHAFQITCVSKEQKNIANSGKPWHVFMVKRTLEPDSYRWGWRLCSYDADELFFWPTHLTTQEERIAWRNDFRDKISGLTMYFKKTDDEQDVVKGLQQEIDTTAQKAAEDAGIFMPHIERDGSVIQVSNIYSPTAVEAVIALLEKKSQKK
jgi:hypothetical protein